MVGLGVLTFVVLADANAQLCPGTIARVRAADGEGPRGDHCVRRATDFRPGAALKAVEAADGCLAPPRAPGAPPELRDARGGGLGDGASDGGDGEHGDARTFECLCVALVVLNVNTSSWGVWIN